MQKVRDQYNRAPYPAVSLWARSPRTAVAHAFYETGAALVHGARESHEGKAAALFGCGTFEPYALGKWQPGAEIHAVDFSPATIARARRRCILRNVRNVTFQNCDLVDFGETHEGAFDYIHSYGVLHHLENPKKGFSALARALKPDGFARVMVYSASSRRRPRLLARAAALCGITSPKEARAFVDGLPWEHPLKLTFLFNPDNANEPGIVDSTLHACENAFTLDELLDVLRAADLEIAAWDFSTNIAGLMENVPGSIEEKIRFLEAFDQWPAPFTFWARKIATSEATARDHVYAALPPPRSPLSVSKQVYSTLLKTNILLTPAHRRIWKSLYQNPKPRSAFGGAEANALSDLIRARFALEIR